MIRIITQNGKQYCVAELKDRLAVYLDNDSLMELAEGAADRRRRFIEALVRRGTLLFSWTNAMEVAGPQRASADAVRSFLDSLGPNWIPVEMNPFEVIRRERAGFGKQAPVSECFMKAYFQDRAGDLSPEASRVLDLSAEAFFRLSAVLDWVQNDRASIQGHGPELDDAFRDDLAQLRKAYENDPKCLDRVLPPVGFDEQQPATFVFVHLRRRFLLTENLFRFGPRDGRDFCHAVLAASYASLATLDRKWKQRVEGLPRPNQLAKVFYRPELDQLVNVFESLSS